MKRWSHKKRQASLFISLSSWVSDIYRIRPKIRFLREPPKHTCFTNVIVIIILTALQDQPHGAKNLLKIEHVSNNKS